MPDNCLSFNLMAFLYSFKLFSTSMRKLICSSLISWFGLVGLNFLFTIKAHLFQIILTKVNSLLLSFSKYILKLNKSFNVFVMKGKHRFSHRFSHRLCYHYFFLVLQVSRISILTELLFRSSY